jgi:thiamine-monophosphate kinase
MSLSGNDDILSDWGEFRLINEIILRLLAPDRGSHLKGDDCAYVRVPKMADSLAITSDVGPKPLVWNIGHESYFTWGWYAVAINASDLATAGAEPLAFTSSVEAPSSMRVADFRDFFRGIASACREFGFPNAGGNIREAPRFECHGTGIGTVGEGPLLGRGGCKPGDQIVAVGECGRFITAYIHAKLRGIPALSVRERDMLLNPRPPLREMARLRRSGFLTAASDNSDGVLGSLWNIVQASSCVVEIEMSDDLIPFEIKDAAASVGADPWNLMLCWGDWQVICAVSAESVERFGKFAAAEGITVQPLGWATAGPPSLYGCRNNRRTPLNLIRNESFTSASFNRGAEAQLAYMLKSPLFRVEGPSDGAGRALESMR